MCNVLKCNKSKTKKSVRLRFGSVVFNLLKFSTVDFVEVKYFVALFYDDE